MPLAVLRRRLRVYCVHLVTRSYQRGDPRPAVGLDPHDHTGGDLLWRQICPLARRVLGHQYVQSRDSLQSFRHPGSSEPSPLLVLDLDIVMIFSPVVADIQHRHLLPSRLPDTSTASRGPCDLMNKCSRRSGHDTPSAVQPPDEPEGARSVNRPPNGGPGSESADPPAAAAAEPFKPCPARLIRFRLQI
jgi:hypothetical protein